MAVPKGKRLAESGDVRGAKRLRGNPNIVLFENRGERERELAGTIVLELAAGKSVKRIAEEMAEQGVTREIVGGVKRRLFDDPHDPTVMDTAQMVEGLKLFTSRALRELNARNLSGEKSKDLVIAAAVAIDKLRLLQGEATVIVGREDRRRVAEAGPKLLAEMRRRGLTVDLPPSEFAEVKP